MSDNAEQVEQITKAPSNVAKREKDPKRVAAGKKLAESNKRMREEHARYKAMEAQRVAEAPTETAPASASATPATEAQASETSNTSDNGSGSDLLSKLTLTNVISLIGIGLAVYNIYVRSRDAKSNDSGSGKHVAWQAPVHTIFEDTPKQSPKPEPKTKPKPKFGM